MNFGHDLLPLTGKIFRLLRAIGAGNHVDIGPGDKVVRLGRDKHQPAQGFVFPHLLQDRADLTAKLGFQGIHLFVWRIDGDHRHVVRTHIEGKRRCHLHYSASRTIAAPRPPAAQAVTRPNPPPRRRNSCSVWVIILAPVAAKGWP